MIAKAIPAPLFFGFLRSPTAFSIIDACSSDGGRIFFHELPEDFDPDAAADWLTFIEFMKPGEAIHLLVKNVSDRAAHYRVRLR